MLIRRYLILLSILLPFAFFSCKEVPRNYNSSLLGPDQINLISFDSFVAGLPQTTHSFKTVIQTGASNTLLLGNYLTHPGNTQVASLLIKLDYSTISDSTKSDLVNGQAAVIDSWIIFTKTYAFGDTSASQIDFGAYKINTSWTSSGFTADSLDPGYFTYGSTDLSGQKILTDSTNRYSVHLQSSAVQEQITNYANGVNDYGIYLKPNLTGNKVWGFG